MLHHITDKDKPGSWTVEKLRPGWTETEIAEDLALFFTKKMDEFEPIDMDHLTTTYSSPIPIALPHEVANRIKGSKKPLSAVQGDPLPCTTAETAGLLAIPATRIFNLSTATMTWPLPWKLETQSAIPNTSNPASYKNLRNISCTNYLSKVMESFLLEKFKSEVKLKYS